MCLLHLHRSCQPQYFEGLLFYAVAGITIYYYLPSICLPDPSLLASGNLHFLGSVLPPYLTLSVWRLSVTEKTKMTRKICDTRRWLCARGKQTATYLFCNRTNYLYLLHSLRSCIISQLCSISSEHLVGLPRLS